MSLTEIFLNAMSDRVAGDRPPSQLLLNSRGHERLINRQDRAEHDILVETINADQPQFDSTEAA